MRMLFVGGAAILAVTAHGAAHAADLRKAPAARAPAMTPIMAAYNWSGFYLGVHVGYGNGETKFIETDADLLAIGFPASQTVDPDGFLGGVQAGWNYQIGSFVYGIEGDLSFSGMDGRSTTMVNIGGDDVAFTRSVDYSWLATVTGRFGYAMDRWLVYGKGGVAFARAKYEDNVTVNGAPFGAGSGSKTHVGWTAGAGVEYAFLDRWSAKLEYNYIDLGKRSVGFSDAILGTDYTMKIDQHIHAIKGGVNYRY
jgi:outer membrane immunogenic protein